ncbi:chitinase-like protein 4 [Ornithodoros turicata]|uniref:chitinase-like protein 4 n=1 Tax=Ornithodoros turicata TaxID=34597 RepID=UPI003139DA84
MEEVAELVPEVPEEHADANQEIQEEPPPSPPIYSINNLTTPEEIYEEPEEITKGVTRCWILTASICVWLVLPLGLVILQFMSKPVHVKFSVDANTSAALRSSTLESSTTSTTAAPTKAVVPQHCGKLINIEDVKPAKVSSPGPQSSIVLTTKNITLFCIYNNSRINHTTFMYLPTNIPGGVCHYVIYWSVAIKDGRIASRVPVFDTTFGLEKLRGAISGDPKILMTVGGYKQDSVQFSMLGRTTGLLPHFVVNVLDYVLDNHLDGINIDWNYPGDECGSQEDHDTLAKLLAHTRTMFSINSQPGRSLIVTVMLPGTWDKLGHHYELYNLAPLVDTMMFNTYEPFYNSTCGIPPVKHPDSDDAFNFFVDYLPDVVRAKACFSATVVFRAMKQQQTGNNIVYKPWNSGNVELGNGRVPVIELCNHLLERYIQSRFKICDEYLVNNEGIQFAAESSVSYKQKFGKLGCVVVHDMDYDSFQRECQAVNASYFGIPDNYGLRKIVDGANALKHP